MKMPKDWAFAQLPDICRMVMGQSPPSSTYNTTKDGMPFFQGKKEFGDRYPEIVQYCNEPNKIAEKDAILMSIRAPVGPTNIAPVKCCIGRGLAALHPYDGIEQNYLLAFLRGQERKLSGEGGGSTFSAVTKDFLSKYEIPVAPLVEQKAIVAKIEALFSELDHGVEQLEVVRTQLKRYRQAVLKAAFEGKLTADWRAEQQKQGNLPTADELLVQIKQERADRYEKQLAEWKQAVKEWEAVGGKDSGEKKPRKPAAPRQVDSLAEEQQSKLPSLPDAWAWNHLGELFSICVGSTPSRKNEAYWRGNIRWISSGEVAFKDILDTEERITQQGLDNASTSVHPAGSVIIAMIGEGKTRGQAAIMRVSACNNQNTAVIRVSDTKCIPEYFYYKLMVDYEKNRLIGSGNNQKALNRTRVELMQFPICSAREQAEIVTVLDARLSVLENLDKTIASGIAQAGALRQSILKKAFEGRLLNERELTAVREDPAYESAVELLERIRNEREKAESKKPGKKWHTQRAYASRQIKLPKGERYRQAAHAAYAVNRLSQRPTFGRVQLMKFLYLAPHLIEQESHIHAERKAAGPLDPAIHKVESLARNSGWFTSRKAGQRVIYSKGQKINDGCKAAERNFGERKAKIDWLLDQFVRFDTERAELLATTFAVWNDHLIDGHEPSEGEIVVGVHGWHPEKAEKFDAGRIGRCIQWIRDNDILPKGTGPKTQVVGGEE